MTYGKGRRFFPGVGAVALATAVLATACTSALEDVPAAEGRSGNATDTGTFPNLNVPRQAATEQFTEAEKQAKLAQLHAVQQRQNPGASGEAKRKRLQVLQDEDATLKVIEGQ